MAYFAAASVTCYVEPVKITAEIAVIGGSGLLSLFDPDSADFVGSVDPETPFGPASAPISVSVVGGRQVAFLPRHGVSHQWPPHTVPYLANLHALSELGVRRIFATAASGSLVESLPPGVLSVPDQLVDLTQGRRRTYFDSFETQFRHASFADPYCPRLRLALLGAGAVEGGTMVVTQGPRLESRAETRWFADAGWSLVNMTGEPEATLARELRICYAALAVTANYAAHLNADAISEAEIMLNLAEYAQQMRQLLTTAITHLPTHPDPGCDCCA